MMERPHIEYIQTQRLPWTAGPAGLGRAGVEMKLLSEDAGDGACTVLLRYPPGFRCSRPVRLGADEEFLVLGGVLRIDGTAYGVHDYAFLPVGLEIGAIEVGDDVGATVLGMFSRSPVAVPVSAETPRFEPDRLIRRIDPLGMKWDNSGQDGPVSELRIARKILRLDPAGKCRTFLLMGLPQTISPTRRRPMEYHTYCEEMFLIAGDIACHCGVMRAGAYFWRPPLIPHGLECSRNGFLALLRIPGSNDNVNHWVQEGPVDFAPPYAPYLPPHLERYRGTGPEAPESY